jgi:hypothetical protein
MDMSTLHSALSATLIPRQSFRNCTRLPDGFIDPNSCDVPFWYTKVGDPAVIHGHENDS